MRKHIIHALCPLSRLVLLAVYGLYQFSTRTLFPLAQKTFDTRPLLAALLGFSVALGLLLCAALCLRPHEQAPSPVPLLAADGLLVLGLLLSGRRAFLGPRTSPELYLVLLVAAVFLLIRDARFAAGLRGRRAP